MGRAHDGQHRSIFPFGNPFKVARTKDSFQSTKLGSIQRTFEETLSVNLTNLKPEVGSDIPCFSWMRNAMEFLSDMHRDINSLIIELDFPVSNWEQQWIDTYLDDSVKLLDVCNAFSSELSHYEQCQLLLRCVLNILGQSEGTPSEERLKKAHCYLNEWRQQINYRNTKLETSYAILKVLSGSLNVANFKKSAKGKVLMRAMYAVKTITVFVCSILSAALTSSSQLLINFCVSEEFPWAQAFNDLQSNVNREMRRRFSGERVVAVSEMDAVGQCVDKLFFATSDSILRMHSAFQPSAASEKKEHQELEATNTGKDEKLTEIMEFTSSLGTNTKILSHGLDSLSKEVKDFFQIVMKGRDYLLSNLRNSHVLQVNKAEKSMF